MHAWMNDGDVGLYVLVARDWLHGALPYTATWEYKPPGLFALYAIALAIFQDGSTASTALAWITAVASTLLLWRFVAVIAGERAGTLAGVFFACLSIENDGMLSDAELLAIPFALGALLLLTGRPSVSSIVASGLLAACAAQMKLTVAPFVLIAGATAAWRGGYGTLPAFAAGAAAPLALETVVYAWAGHAAAFWDANVGATLRRAWVHVPSAASHKPLFPQLRILAPALELAPFAVLARTPWIVVLAAWFALNAAIIVVVGEYDLRQLLALLAPMSALAAIGADALGTRLAKPRFTTIFVGLLAFALHGYYEVRVQVQRILPHRASMFTPVYTDDERMINTLRAIKSSDRVWIVELTPMLYDVSGHEPPTRYPLTSNLFDRRMWPMLGMDGRRELLRIFNKVRPDWILIHTCGPWCDPSTQLLFRDEVHANYAFVGPVGVYTGLYRRIRHPSNVGTVSSRSRTDRAPSQPYAQRHLRSSSVANTSREPAAESPRQLRQDSSGSASVPDGAASHVRRVRAFASP